MGFLIVAGLSLISIGARLIVELDQPLNLAADIVITSVSIVIIVCSLTLRQWALLKASKDLLPDKKAYDCIWQNIKVTQACDINSLEHLVTTCQRCVKLDSLWSTVGISWRFYQDNSLLDIYLVILLMREYEHWCLIDDRLKINHCR